MLNKKVQLSGVLNEMLIGKIIEITFFEGEAMFVVEITEGKYAGEQFEAVASQIKVVK